MADAFWDLPENSPIRHTKPPSRRRKRTLGIFEAIAALLVVGLFTLTAAVVVGYQATGQPDPNADFQTATTYVYYNDGKTELGTFEVQNRQPLTFDEMPENIKLAVVAAENRSFWTDPGISLRGMFRAASVIARGSTVQGGSTITQQYIKILYLNRDQTATRKLRELFLAAKMSQQLSKRDILTGYLNTIYFGRDAYGIQAASRAYFAVDAKQLTIPQAAVLASVLNSPNTLDPDAADDNAARLLGRYRYVLTAMSETGAITATQATSFARSLPTFPEIKASQRYGGTKGFLLKMVQRELEAAGVDATRINGGGLRITTTFDVKSQQAAVEAAQKYTKKSANASGEKKSGLHAAIASVEVGTGQVLALYGGADYVENSRNWATTARPTASTFKAYALAAGLQDGYSLRSRFNGNTFTPPGETKPVRNEYSQQYGRRVDLIEATADSINTAFVDLVTSMKGGADKVIQLATASGLPRAAGFDATARNLPLGTPEASPLSQAGAYATFANDGNYMPNHVVREVRDPDGKLIYSASPVEQRAMSSDIAADVTFALSSVVEEGTGRSVRTLNRPVAGKTGTKDRGDDITSAWFVAYTRQISTAVMYVAGTGDLDKYRQPGDSTFFGGTYPALTWADYMEAATDGMEVKDFAPPAYVNGDAADAAERTQTSERNESESATSKPRESSSPERSRTPQPESPPDEPTEDPTDEFTENPTDEPSQATREPSTEPTEEPTSAPTTGRSRASSSPATAGRAGTPR